MHSLKQQFAAVINGRYEAPKNYNPSKLQRLRNYYGNKLQVESETCRINASVQQAGHRITWVFYTK